MSANRVRKREAYLALERLESYRDKLNKTGDRELRQALDQAITAIRSKLFQALLDIQEFYVHTLDASLPESQKADQTRQLADRWKTHSPVPTTPREDQPQERTAPFTSSTPRKVLPSPIPVVQPTEVKPSVNHVPPVQDPNTEMVVLHRVSASSLLQPS